MNYAQLNEEGYCIGVSSLSGEVNQDSMILLEKHDTSYLGRKYDFQNKKWTDEYCAEPKEQRSNGLTIE